MSRDYPVILTIAGSDSSGGAGIQADIKTASALGVYAMTAITAVTAQNTFGVRSLEAVSPSLLKSQLETVTDDVMPDVIKIGMIPDVTSASIIADFLEKVNVPVVADPVISSTSGHLFSSKETLEVMKKRIFPLVSLLTPNIPEARIIMGKEVNGMGSISGLAEGMIDRFGCRGVLIKGGHGDGEILTDTLIVTMDKETGKLFKGEYSHPRISTTNTHGTGCTLSSAIAAFMAHGLSVSEAVAEGIRYLEEVLIENKEIRFWHGHGPVGYLSRMKPGRNKKC